MPGTSFVRIGVDATCWTNRRGYGRFSRALLKAVLELDSANHYVFFADDISPQFPFPDTAEVVQVRTSVPTVKAAAADGYRSLRDMWSLSRAMSRAQLDSMFFPSIYSFVPLVSFVPKLVTIHDVIPELFPELVFPSTRAKLFWRAKLALGCSQARLILTVSDYSRRCLVEHLKIEESRIRVVQEAGDPVFRPVPPDTCEPLLRRLGLHGAPYFVYLGGFSPHKNLGALVDILADLRKHHAQQRARLVLVGDYQKDVFYSCYSDLVARIQQAGLQEQIIFTGYLDDHEAAQLLSSAVAVLLPSFCEGVGLPALEAAACGTPGVVTTRSPLKALLGEGVIALEPQDRAGWHQAAFRLLTENGLRDSMRKAALEAVSRLSWRRSAQQLLDAFQEVGSTRAATA